MIEPFAGADISASLSFGIWAERDWPDAPVKENDLTNEQIEWIGSWLAGEGWVRL